MSPAAVQIDDQAVASLCRKHGVAKLSVFGSVLRSDFDADRSDIDLLVDFLPGERKNLFKLLEMERELSRMFGRRVELTTRGSLSKYFRDEVLASARVVYDSAV